ncbi:pitrilysin family protein [Roseivirga sp.]|uniref:M16 family metallopeptidase n=1 Tax=Roseivirga sp. TaxID=1964215 RepID=UPI002B275CED|nr:pitrilysin family protein [Roseivirga sp.]
MIQFERFELKNGLQVIYHEDLTSPMVVVNVLYNVGSRDEEEHCTGFAHLFEHLMFGGSLNVPNYDEPLQKVGGENNAFTSPDITNYYITLPAENMETAFWLESDRMLSLSFDPKVLEVQRSVVIEEFKQRYLNQPYGDAWLKLRPLVYKEHPYKWATIGKEIEHIEKATMEDVKDFFYRFYKPNNAVLVVAGNTSLEEVKRLSEKWFGEIPKGETNERKLPQEPAQTEYRELEIEASVPADSLYIAFHMEGRADEKYYATDLLSDILGRGKSSLLHDQLVEKQRLFSSIGAYVMGSSDPGLLVINGQLSAGVSLAEAEKAVWDLIEEFKNTSIEAATLQKVKNKAESTIVFGEVELLNRAMNLAHAWTLGDPDIVNHEGEKIQAVTVEDIKEQANKILVKTNASVLRYKAKNEI